MLSHFSNVQAEGEYATWVRVGWNISRDSLISWFLGFVDLICTSTFSSSLRDNNNAFLIQCIGELSILSDELFLHRKSNSTHLSYS